MIRFDLAVQGPFAYSQVLRGPPAVPVGLPEGGLDGDFFDFRHGHAGPIDHLFGPVGLHGQHVGHQGVIAQIDDLNPLRALVNTALQVPDLHP